MVDYISRIKAMRDTPLMWAITKEGFISQICCWLEVGGYLKTNDFYHEFLGHKDNAGSNVHLARECLDDNAKEWTRKVAERALECLVQEVIED